MPFVKIQIAQMRPGGGVSRIFFNRGPGLPDMSQPFRRMPGIFTLYAERGFGRLPCRGGYAFGGRKQVSGEQSAAKRGNGEDTGCADEHDAAGMAVRRGSLWGLGHEGSVFFRLALLWT